MLKRASRFLFAIIALIILFVIRISWSEPGIEIISTKVELSKNIQLKWTYQPERCYQQDDGIYDKEHSHNNMEFWNNMTDDEIDGHRKDWTKFVDSTPPRRISGKRGVVYTSYSGMLKFTIVSIKLLRKYGCLLPVEIWYFGDEMSIQDFKAINEIDNVKAKDLKQVNDSGFVFKKPKGDKMFEMKGASIVYSDFDQILFLDSDVYKANLEYAIPGSYFSV